MLHTLDPDADFVHVSLVGGGLWPASAQMVGEARRELLAPASHRFIGDDHTAFRRDQLNIAQTDADNGA